MRRLIASSLGLGRGLGRIRGNDSGSGTIGALAAIPVALVTLQAGTLVQVGALLLLTVAGWWAVRPFADGDPGWVVIDETVGAMLAVIGLSGLPFAVGWTIARAADISKAFPGVKRAESLGGAAGVMMDDLVAGCWGLAAGWILAVSL